ncbi:MAG: ChbG/HpnK family deacetylase [Chloroflexales bacterium]|nr:ChbG/HpnK family deacetylase [Chloroflexales bacterium]
MKQLIITADDYGLCESVNQAIESCLAAGAMRSTCVMTNMAAYAEAEVLRKRFPAASIGIHWTLTQGQPVLSPQKIPTLVNTMGEFFTWSELRRRVLKRQVDPAHIRAELVAQHQRLTALIGPVDFWNTHQNVHVSPGLFHICVSSGQELGIPAMRCHRRITMPRRGSATWYHMWHPLYWIKGVVIDQWSLWAARQGMAMPAGMISTPGYGRGKAAIEEMMRQVRWPTLKRAAELVIHPATSIVGELFGQLRESRLREYAVFSDPGLKDRLWEMGLITVGFESLYLRSTG